MLLIALQYILHETIAEAWDSWLDGAEGRLRPADRAACADGRAWSPCVVVWRLGLRLTHGAPPPPEGEHPALKLVAPCRPIGPFTPLMLLLPGLGRCGGGSAASEAAAEAQ